MAEAEAPKVPATKSAAASVPMEADGKVISFKPRNFEELWSFVQSIANTEMVPAADRGKTGQIIAKMQYGSEVGLPPMQSLRWIAVLPNGLPTIWGDGSKMLVTSHPLCEGLWEMQPHEVMEKGYAECTIKRKGWKEPVVRRYTKAMAEQAGLWGGKGSDQYKKEQSTWFKYGWRMLMWRAFHLAASDAIPEAMGGLVPREIAEDYDIEITAKKVEDPTPTPQPLQDERGMTDVEATPTDGPGDSAGESGSSGGSSAAGASADQPSGSADQRAPADSKKPAGATIEERRAWINDPARTVEDFHHKAAPLMNMKGLTQAEQASIFTAFNDRKQALIKAQKEEPTSGD